MPACFRKIGICGLKWVSGYPSNRDLGLPQIAGLMVVDDMETSPPPRLQISLRGATVKYPRGISQIGKALFDLLAWMDWMVQSYGYLGAFAVCFLGNVTILLPVPFALVVYAFGATLDPLILGLVSGVGCTVGELSAYLVGRGGRKIVEGRYGDRLDAVERLIDRYGALLVFLAALLPIPDDLILVPLGILKYDLKRIFGAMLAGKILMCLVIAYAGHYSYSMIVDIFESSGLMGVAASVVLLVIILYIMIKVDWTKLIDSVTKAAS